MAFWFQPKNLKLAVPPSARATSALCPSALTKAISSSGEYHSDRRGHLAMSSTPSSPIDIRANGQPVATMPNAVGTDRLTPMNVCWVTADRCYWSRASRMQLRTMARIATNQLGFDPMPTSGGSCRARIGREMSRPVIDRPPTNPLCVKRAISGSFRRDEPGRRRRARMPKVWWVRE
jgi:hypothetical protein